MNRAQLEHVVRAAASIVGVTDLVVIGSQAILGTCPDWALPREATISLEADIAVDPRLAGVELVADGSHFADRIDGAIGEGSLFHATHGYYAQGVEVTTAVLSRGWRERLVAFVAESSEEPVVAWCLERHDLWIAKAAAGRAKDIEFCRALAAAGLVDHDVCRERISELDDPYRTRASGVLLRSF